MLQTRVSNPSFSRRVVARAETRVVFPAPWTPLRPMKNGLPSCWGEERNAESCRRMNGMQCGDLSSIISGFDLGVKEAFGATFADAVLDDILKGLVSH